LHYRILNVGPDSGVRSSLRELVAQTDGLVLLQHIETGSIALDILSKLPESELPHIVIIPFRLPILTSLDFISAMHSHQRLRSIPILVWWPEMEVQEIKQLYQGGATCVLLGQFGTSHLDAVRRFCRDWTGIETAVTVNPSLRATSPISQQTGEEGGRNVRLGTLFVWTGCVSAALWLFGFLQFTSSYKVVDLAPLPVYASLAGAGLSLMWRRPDDGVRAIP